MPAALNTRAASCLLPRPPWKTKCDAAGIGACISPEIATRESQRVVSVDVLNVFMELLTDLKQESVPNFIIE